MIPESGTHNDFKHSVLRECADLPVVGGRYESDALQIVFTVVEDRGLVMGCRTVKSYSSHFADGGIFDMWVDVWIGVVQQGKIKRLPDKGCISMPQPVFDVKFFY